MNKILFIYAFFGIILLYNVDGGVVRKRKDIKLPDWLPNPLEWKDDAEKIINSMGSLISHLENSSPNRTLVAEDIQGIMQVIDKIKGTPIDGVFKSVVQALSELKSAVENPSNQVYLDACGNALKVIKPILDDIKKEINNILEPFGVQI
ncbi:uncharacterized protein LOC111638419 [Centruroides sculpturatus]|uniref:uncharacterized protein LOC111638419 n=1 Tax=Centruroides sculpturatus TaxID=218467 RepID=UPI000C6EFCF0|nr:uncharacterized protein LOC111638419 [Centruroides sculpturatus]